MRRVFASVVVLALIGLGTFAPGVLSAAPASPAARPTAGPLALVAHGLTNPRGFTWGPDGTLYVALAGTGGPHPGTVKAPVVQAVGTLMGGKTASVVKIISGCPVTIAGNLASVRDAGGVTVGAAAVAFLHGDLYVLIAGGGAVAANPDMPNGVYRITADGATTLVANIGGWIPQHPVADVRGPADYSPDGDPYAMVADPQAGVLWVVESNSGQLLKVGLDGTITRAADFSVGDNVPTALALAPDGGVYVGFLTPVPFLDGTAKVVKVAPDGTVTDVWSGLTMVTAIAVGPDGTLYALEMSTGNTKTIPFMVPNTGKLVHQTGPASAAALATELPLPDAMAFGPDGALYVAFPGIGANVGQGGIFRFLPTGGGPPLTMHDLVDTLPACAPVATPAVLGTPSLPPFEPATPAATPAA